MSELIPSSITSSRKRPEQSEEHQIVTKKAKKDKEEAEDMTAQCLNYTVKDGIRHLSPYWTSYNTWTKRRWLGRTFEEVFSKEFLSVDKNYARVACKFGRIFINGKQMTNPGHVLNDNEKIVHVGHRHELPILDIPIEIIANTDDYLVVNKPPSLPVHACGQYKANTVLARLIAEHGMEDLRGKNFLNFWKI
uniref:Pseudouridine synthase RsuA/RluA-like domain-containing protein n=1 Tax=Panagrolaimus sp. PS1159 TaxID=55785 RepID=A0AC35FPH6_9BILA